MDAGLVLWNNLIEYYMAGKKAENKAENKELNYTESVERLEGIVKKIESGEMDIDQLTSQVAEAANLIKACKEKLFSTNEAVEKLLKELDK